MYLVIRILKGKIMANKMFLASYILAIMKNHAKILYEKTGQQYLILTKAFFRMQILNQSFIGFKKKYVIKID